MHGRLTAILFCWACTPPLLADEICPAAQSSNNAQHLVEAGWEEYFNDTGVTVYNRTIQNSEVHEVLATAVLDYPSEQIVSILSDYPRYIEFMPYVEKSTVVTQKENSTLLFQQLNFPWPISDRHFVIELTSKSDNRGSHFISWTLATETGDAPTGNGIALKTDDGYWKLCPINSGNSTYIEYFIHTDPGGILPFWVINQANIQAVPEVINALEKRTKSISSE